MMIRKEEFLRSLKHLAGQKFTWFAIFMVSLTASAFSSRTDEQQATTLEEVADMAGPELDNLSNTAPITETPEAVAGAETALPVAEPAKPTLTTAPQPLALAYSKAIKGTSANRANKLIAYANSLMGTPYVWGGTSKKGFDCSGFIYHVFSTVEVDLERSSRMQGTQGQEVSLEQLVPGDLVFFTGTNPKVREVGHVGIVISEPGEPVSFIHSSSNGGVKVSELEGYYSTRYMFAKRML